MKALSVCIGTSCHLNGANNVIMSFRHLIEEKGLHDKIELSAKFCANNCSEKGVSVTFDNKVYKISYEDSRRFFIETVIPSFNNQK